MDRRIHSKQSFLGLNNIGCLNVQTLLQTGKQALLAKSIYDRDVDICCVSELRMPNDGTATISVPHKKGSIQLFYSGPTNGSGLAGVGFALSQKAAKAVIAWKPINSRLAYLRVKSRPFNVSLLSVYAPTNAIDPATIEEFYHQLEDELSLIPRKDFLIVAGDFNAQVGGSRRQGKITGCYTPHTNTCQNGERLIELASHHGLMLTNTFFCHKKRHLQTWVSPDGATRNQIDYILIKQKWSKSVTDCRSFWGLDVATDHALVAAKFHLKFQNRMHKPAPKRPNIHSLQDPKIRDHFMKSLGEEASKSDKMPQSVDESWSLLRKQLQATVNECIPPYEHQKNDWISHATIQLSQQRKLALANNNHPLAAQLAREVKRSARQDKETFYNQLATELETAQHHGDYRKFFRLVRVTAGKYSTSVSQCITDKTGHKITDVEARLTRWCEYFEELLNRPEPVTTETENTDAPNHQPYDINDLPPSGLEIAAVIQKLKNNKAPGDDCLSAEIFKAGGIHVISAMESVFSLIWKEERIPKDWETALLLPLYKKGAKTECKNYRGISLINLAYKILEAIILNRIKDGRQQRTRENQAGFRSGRGCTDQISALRHLLELRHEFRQPTYVAFLDFTAAFDSIHRESLWKLLHQDGIPNKLCGIITALYRHTSCKVKAYNEESDAFAVNSGVRQGGILSPTLFNIGMDAILSKALDNQPGGVVIYPNNFILTDLTFADDIALIADSLDSLQGMVDRVAKEAASLGLVLSGNKSKLLMCCNHVDDQTIHIQNEPIETVEHFTYLGSNITGNGDVSSEISARIQKATIAWSSLKKLWARKDIRLKTKVRIYKAAIIPTLLYGCETWPIKVAHQHNLDLFQNRCLRRLTKIKYSERISNAEIRRRCDINENVSAIIELRRWRWLGHTLRMPDNRIPKISLLAEPGPTWKRPKGGVRLTTLRHFKRKAEDIVMRPFNLSRKSYNSDWLHHLTTLAQDRKQWRQVSMEVAYTHDG